MVMVSPLEKVSPVAKLAVGAEDGNVNVRRTPSRRGTQNQSSLFSSSLSELVNHKLRLSSNNFLSHELSTTTNQNGVLGPPRPREETGGQTMSNVLPDDDELFSGMVDEMGITGHANSTDDFEDFDVFTCGGGIELEPVDRRNAGHSWGCNPNYHSTNGPEFVCNGFQSRVSLSSVGSGLGVSESSQSYRIPSFHPHSAQVQLHSLGITNCSDSMSGITAQSKVNMDIHHLGLNGHAIDLNKGVFGYSPSRIHTHQTLPKKSNSYQQHHLHSLLMSNSPSLPTYHTHHLRQLPGSPGVSHLTMNMVSPIHQLRGGSTPGQASLWERQHDSSGYQIEAVRGFSASHPREISSHGSLPRGHGFYSEVHSPQRMTSHVFLDRSAMGSLPTSFGSPSERLRSRRSEANNVSHADRKHYELNIDRILRGDDTRTTLMIKNIPNKYTSKMLLATIDEQHRGNYDFIYLPIDFKNKCNMGYAFINMVNPLRIVSFHKTFEGRKWEKFNSEKVATLAYARIQGKSALIAHFQNSSLMNEDRRCRPILFHTDGPNAGDQEPFPMGTNFQTKPARLHVQFGEDNDE